MSRQKKNKPLKAKRRVADNRVGVQIEVEHPGTNRRSRRAAGINNNVKAQKRAQARAEKEALDQAEEV